MKRWGLNDLLDICSILCGQNNLMYFEYFFQFKGHTMYNTNPFDFWQNGYWKSLTVWQFLWNAFRSLRGAFEPVSVSFQEIHNCLLWDFGKCCTNYKMMWCQKTFRVIDQFWGKLSQSCLTFNPFWIECGGKKICFSYLGNEKQPYYLLSSCALFPPGVTNWCGWVAFI